MSDIVEILLAINRDITRNFQLDYIIFDALFLAVYIALLISNRRYAALKAGIVCGILVYIIDGVIWFALGIREYGLTAPWIKHPTDFTMDVSYGIVAFSWVWIAFEKKSYADVAFWTVLLFAGWLAVPLASRSLSLDDTPITTVRHMHRQVWLQIAVVVVGYALMALLKYNWGTILYVFWVGAMLAFMMEFSLLVSGIRPPDVRVLVYETLILTNQGTPYLYVLWVRILPAVLKRIAAREKEKGNIAAR
jgi:hypothetical protein